MCDGPNVDWVGMCEVRYYAGSEGLAFFIVFLVGCFVWISFATYCFSLNVTKYVLTCSDV